jgi:DNA-binding CsgD family transcriptional regulator
VSLNEMSPAGVHTAIVEPELDEEWYRLFGELGQENPLYQHYLATGDGRANRFTDVTTREQLEATRLFQDFYRPLGVRHQIAFTLPSQVERVVAIALSRDGSDFSDEERDFLNRARPFLIQAYRNAMAYSGLAPGTRSDLVAPLIANGLTAREAEVMSLVAVGTSTADIATRCSLSPRTVQKHLERAFRKLGVTSRSAAAARAWELLERS